MELKTGEDCKSVREIINAGLAKPRNEKEKLGDVFGMGNGL